MKKLFMIFFLILTLCLSTDDAFTQTQPQVQITKDKTLQYAKPKKPLRIKLHRDKRGEYSWDITGESVDEVIKADRRLRQLFKEE